MDDFSTFVSQNHLPACEDSAPVRISRTTRLSRNHNQFGYSWKEGFRGAGASPAVFAIFNCGQTASKVPVPQKK